ncbi:CDP-alcohol phosphatidyltransferase family protein [Phaeocystidibacter luteus]|uniref:CDP-alcohol phosphatidyltransferase family protein n=1 Tax=Phaeocystidibacter luteus TaxID=911197 RepID=A0A6N6RHY0_9FLAO|nr:CDP-alcohol phosphatidyltransferase family protein [Phaeocystidibacter luteus]KAB2809887.1 CDP-alcohol phosphatidyltransferase family protein [Phaeocystidibacter luteus]
MSVRNQWATIPNALSAYRLLAFPMLIFSILKDYEQLFAILIVINLITDILDGVIARVFNMATELGARLDSIADYTTYAAAIWGLFAFKWTFLEPHLISFLIFLGLFLSTIGFALAKFGRMPSLHLYSFKIGGYLQGIFFFITFAFEFYDWAYYIMLIWSYFAFVEHITVQIVIPEMKSNAKGLYWVLKEK